MSTLTLDPTNTSRLICNNVSCTQKTEADPPSYKGVQADDAVWSKTEDLIHHMVDVQIDEFIAHKLNQCCFLVATDVSLSQKFGPDRKVFAIMPATAIKRKFSKIQNNFDDDFNRLLDGSVSKTIIKIAGLHLNVNGEVKYIFISHADLEKAKAARISAIAWGEFLLSGTYNLPNGTVCDISLRQIEGAKLVGISKEQYAMMKEVCRSGTPVHKEKKEEDLPISPTPALKHEKRRRFKLFRSSKPDSCLIV